MGTAERLRAALAGLVDGLPPRQAAAGVERLIAHYRHGVPAGAPVLRNRADAVSYAAYRMPATFEAVTAALGALAAQPVPAGMRGYPGGRRTPVSPERREGAGCQWENRWCARTGTIRGIDPGMPRVT